MTTNAYIFSWDQYGIEGIIPITEYEHWEHEQLLDILADKTTKRNPIHGIIQSLVLRAKFNPQRHYEIYAIDCSDDLTVDFWRKQWEENPQSTAELIRQRGMKIFSDRNTERSQIKIT
jgi:hypothetical protein